jgi:hypothetical protein
VQICPDGTPYIMTVADPYPTSRRGAWMAQYPALLWNNFMSTFLGQPLPPFPATYVRISFDATSR